MLGLCLATTGAAAWATTTSTANPIEDQPLADDNAPQRWSVEQVVRHIDALDRVSPPQSAAQEVMRILAGIMHQPDAATRMALFERLRPHITPYRATDATRRRTP